ncbi:MAG: hypothetical protein ACM3H7_01160 [Acidobacteriaceae bacterium]
MSFLVLAGIMACSISGIGQGIKSAEQTSRGVRTKISGAVTVGSSIIENAQTFEAQSRAVIATVKAVTTQEAPIISTGEAAATQFPQYIQTVQAIFKDEIPSGEPPSDIPLQDMAQMEDFFASSQYIFYITPVKYAQVLSFYRIGMADNGWEYQQDESSEYAQATQMIFYKDSRTAVVNLSYNTLNNTTVVIITIISQ